MKKINYTERAILVTLALGVWFVGISLWVKPEIANARRMSVHKLSNLQNEVINILHNCKARVHGGTKAHDAQIICYDKGGK